MRMVGKILKRGHLEHIDISFFGPGAAGRCSSGCWLLRVAPQALGKCKNAFAQQVAADLTRVDDH